MFVVNSQRITKSLEFPKGITFKCISKEELLLECVALQEAAFAKRLDETLDELKGSIISFIQGSRAKKVNYEGQVENSPISVATDPTPSDKTGIQVNDDDMAFLDQVDEALESTPRHIEKSRSFDQFDEFYPSNDQDAEEKDTASINVTGFNPDRFIDYSGTATTSNFKDGRDYDSNSQPRSYIAPKTARLGIYGFRSPKELKRF